MKNVFTFKNFVVVMLAIIFVAPTMSRCNNPVNEEPIIEKNNASIEIIEDANQFSRISLEKLIAIMGEPLESETWTNKTTTANYEVTTHSYDKNQNHYEFITYKDMVVRLTIYSGHYWADGESFEYSGDNDDILKAFNIDDKGYTSKIIANTGNAYRVENINDDIKDFWVQEMTDNTYDIVKITYDTLCFE